MAETKYILDVRDCDDDRITLHKPETWGGDYMLRIQNDDMKCGVVIDGPLAMQLVGALLPIVRDFKLDSYLDVEVE